MIKLQLLLRHPSAEPKLDADLRARLEQHRFTITGSGRASVSASMGEADFAATFGAHGALQSGFAPLAAESLPVPPALEPDISLITFVPRHGTTNYHPRGHHASV